MKKWKILVMIPVIAAMMIILVKGAMILLIDSEGASDFSIESVSSVHRSTGSDDGTFGSSAGEKEKSDKADQKSGSSDQKSDKENRKNDGFGNADESEEISDEISGEPAAFGNGQLSPADGLTGTANYKDEELSYMLKQYLEDHAFKVSKVEVDSTEGNVATLTAYASDGDELHRIGTYQVNRTSGTGYKFDAKQNAYVDPLIDFNAPGTNAPGSYVSPDSSDSSSNYDSGDNTVVPPILTDAEDYSDERYSGLRFKWNPVKNATGYEFYVNYTLEGESKYKTRVEQTTDTRANVYYKNKADMEIYVRAYRKTNRGTIYSDWACKVIPLDEVNRINEQR